MSFLARIGQGPKYSVAARLYLTTDNLDTEL